MRSAFTNKASILGVLLATSVITASVAGGPEPFTDCYVLDWKALYPTSQSMNNVLNGTGTTCQLCHEKTTGDIGWNEYRQRVRLFILGGNSAPNAIKLSEPFNSDGDPSGSPNIAEITADTQPGWTPGPNNTIYGVFSNTPNQLPPAAIVGNLDPGGPGCPNIATYCTAKPGLACGVPSISSTGTPSASATSGFLIQASPARSKKTGILLYTSTGRANQPFPSGGHILCLSTPPLRRGGPVDSGGTPGPNCDGVFTLDMNAFAHGLWVPQGGQASNNPAPFLRSISQQINCQWWGRDSVATGTFMSDALEYIVCP